MKRMARIETWLKCDLKQMVQVEKLNGNMFSADNGANRVGVIVTDNGADVTLTENVTGYVIRQDDATVVVVGSTTGNRAYIDLPTSAYVVPGLISIVIKLGTTTVGACCGLVTRSSTDTIVDPGHVIPSIEELLAKIAACEAATTAATAAATAANTAATNANTKAGLADTAATNANTKAGLADEAATNANSKASLANDAATLANTKAGLANTAAGNADTKAGLANTAAGRANSAAALIENLTALVNGLAAGDSPTVVVTTVDGHYVITFGIPKGDKGDQGIQGIQGIQGERGLQGVQGPVGATPDLVIGNVQTLPEGSQATATMTGTAEEPVLNLGIPRGDTGAAAAVIELGAVEYAFHIDERDHLILSYGGAEPPNFYINDDGHLIYEF